MNLNLLHGAVTGINKHVWVRKKLRASEFFFNQKLSIRDVVLGNVRNVSIREVPFGKVSAGTNVTAPFLCLKKFFKFVFFFQ